MEEETPDLNKLVEAILYVGYQMRTKGKIKSEGDYVAGFKKFQEEFEKANPVKKGLFD